MKTENDEIYCLIKFGSEGNMTKLIDKGEIYFNTSEYFNNVKKNDERGDSYEGAKFVNNIQVEKVESKHPELGNHIFNPVTNKLSKIILYNDNCLLYSLYAISTNTFFNKNHHIIKNDVKEFGSHAVLIKEPYTFLNTIIDHLKSKGIEYEMRPVEYLSYDQEGEMKLSPFNKKEEHSHQNEFRIIIKSINNTSVTIQIGCIKDYCEILTSQSITEMDWNVKRK